VNIYPSLALSIALVGTIALSGCASGGRAMQFPRESAPTATASQIVMRLTEIERSPGSVTLRITITNPTAEPAVFARSYGVFTAATLIHGDEHITGVRVPKQSRTLSPNQYTVLAGEDAVVSLDFRAADIDRASNLSLSVRGSTHGIDQTWTIAIPPVPSINHG